MGTHKMPECNCPHCGKKQDRASNANELDAAPDPGDFSVCNGCGTILEFDETLHLKIADQTRFEQEVTEETKKEIRKFSNFIKSIRI